jgi:hypothetical protein
MPLRKFHSVEEMPGPTWHDPSDPELWRRITDLWAFSDRLCCRRLPPGVHRNRSMEELNRRRAAWEAAAVRSGRN